jgi:hypothetical protein
LLEARLSKLACLYPGQREKECGNDATLKSP